MSTEQHEALKYAEILKENVRNGYVTSSKDELKIVSMLRTQHALIVQMAEALTGAKSSLDDYNCGAPWSAYDKVNLRWVEAANKDATQYLTRGPKT